MSKGNDESSVVITPQRHASVEAELFYWAVLDDRDGLANTELGGQGSKPLPESLFDLVQTQIPVPIEGLHVVCAAAGNGRVIACGVESEKLRSIADAYGTDLLSLTPNKIPVELGLDQNLSSQLNMLVGVFEPVPVRTARRRIKQTAVVGVVSVCALLLLGIELRTWACHARIDKHSTAKAQVLRAAGFKTIDDLSREESRLRSINRSAERSQDALSAIQSVAKVIGAWPRGNDSPFVRTDSIQAAHDAIGLTVSAESSEDAEKLIEALKRVKGWTLAQPQYSRPVPSSGGFSSRIGSGDNLMLRLRLTKDAQSQSRTESRPVQGERGMQ